jgi:hypothetical protein
MNVIRIRAMSALCMPIVTMNSANVAQDIPEMAKSAIKLIRAKIVTNTQRAKMLDTVVNNACAILDTKVTDNPVKKQPVHVITVMITPPAKQKDIRQFPNASVTLVTPVTDFIATKTIHVKTVLPTPHAKRVNASATVPVIGGTGTSASTRTNVTIPPTTTVTNTPTVPTPMVDTPVNVKPVIPVTALPVTRTPIHVINVTSTLTARSHMVTEPANAKMDILEMVKIAPKTEIRTIHRHIQQNRRIQLEPMFQFIPSLNLDSVPLWDTIGKMKNDYWPLCNGQRIQQYIPIWSNK